MQVIRQSASGQQQPPITTDALFRLQILISGIIFLIYGNCILYDMQIVVCTYYYYIGGSPLAGDEWRDIVIVLNKTDCNICCVV